ncbi:uncharacterized protein ELE39_001440 [Cryptosporidium sp. chipmunk genotype I]|uniref:uncharacterized protein n=1 Tax=Cryptosporidium sp. chipmunk genotype I TaxID=1280935 RepID=UPI00351A2522|nr:hypothetical protein ELE39_001440 [Cryptosporidium sp. chipmunk genotype I]
MDLVLSPNSLLKELIANKKFVHLVSKDVLAITDNYLDFVWDIGVSGPRGSEDKIFNSNKRLIGLLRRGLSLGIKLPLENQKNESRKWFEYDPDKINIWILKRGMEKFGDLFIDNKKRMEQITPILERGLKGLKLVALEKLDGENSQISYFDITDQWVIGSKNVTILCRDVNDIESIVYTEGRYDSVKVSAYSWFRTLEQFKTCCVGDFETEINNLKRLLLNNTLLCETIGNTNRQHIVNYSHVTNPQLYFFGIVSKEDEQYSCYSPITLMKFLDPFFFKYIAQFVNLPSQFDVSESLEKRKFENTCISFSPIFSFNDQIFDFKSIDELNNYLSVIQSIVLTLRTNTEGIVLYLIERGQKPDKDIVLCTFKIKSLRFSSLRLVRENLKDLIIKNFVIDGLDEYKKARSNPYNMQNSMLKYSVDNFWFSVYKYLLILIQNTAENFFNVTNRNFKIIRKQISDVYSLFETEIVKQIESDFVFFKQLILYSSIYLLTKMIYLNLEANKTDNVQLTRYFFDSFSSFISDMESQMSSSRKITGIPRSICPHYNGCLCGSVDISPRNLGNIPSGSIIEFIVPPFNWSWKEIKDMLSSDFSLSHDTWVLNKDDSYLTLEQKDFSESYLSSFPKAKYHIIVNLRHVFDDSVPQERNQLYSCYKIFMFDKLNSSSNSTKEAIFTKTENSIKLSKFKSSSIQQFEGIIKKLDSIITKNIIDEIGTKEYHQLSQNHQLVRKLEVLPTMLPWANYNNIGIFPFDYATNMRDFEHLLYAIFGSNDFNYVVNTFYHCELDLDLKKTNEVTDNLTKCYFNLESTFVLPCGIPGSGKSFVLKSFIQKLLSAQRKSYYVSALTSGKHVTEFDMNDEPIYSLVVPSNTKSSNNKNFDLVLYISKDGCTQSLLNGFKWNYNALIFDKIPETYIEYSAPANSSEDLSETEFRNLSKKSKSCMNFIIESFIKLCSGIVKGDYEKNSAKNENSPEWLKHLKSVYDCSRNLRLLILVDMNHTPEAFVQISEDFSSKFKLTEVTLYRTLVLFITANFGKFKRKPKKWRFLFRSEEVIMSILKVIKRENHSTLKGLSRKSVSVLLHFLILYSQNVKVLKKDGKVINSMLSKSTFKSLGFKGVIEVKNDYSTFLSELRKNYKKTYNSLNSDLSHILNNNADIQDPKNDKNPIKRFMNNLEKLSKSIGELPNFIDTASINSFYSSIYSMCYSIPLKGSDINLRNLYYDLGNNLIIKSFDLNIHPRGELGDYLSQIRSKYSLTAITFENHKSSMEAITRIWNEHKKSLTKVINGKLRSKESEDHDLTELGDIQESKIHVTCCFFGRKAGPDTGDKSKIGSLLDGQTISNLVILLSLPFISRSYDFQVSYLIYIHSWKLAFLTVSPLSKLFEILSNDKHYDILIQKEIPPHSIDEDDKEYDSYSNCDQFESCDSKTSLLLTSLLPFGENGHSHITLISGKFNPVITNVAIGLLGEGFSELSNISVNECGIRAFEVQVNEEPLEGILNKGLSEDDSKLDPVKTLKILAIRLWDKKIMLKGDLGYM